MKKAEVCALIEEIGIVPAIRMSSAEDAHFAAESITSGGVPIVEITMTVAGAIGLISHLVRYHPKHGRRRRNHYGHRNGATMRRCWREFLNQSRP